MSLLIFEGQRDKSRMRSLGVKEFDTTVLRQLLYHLVQDDATHVHSVFSSIQKKMYDLQLHSEAKQNQQPGLFVFCLNNCYTIEDHLYYLLE